MRVVLLKVCLAPKLVNRTIGLPPSCHFLRLLKPRNRGFRLHRQPSQAFRCSWNRIKREAVLGFRSAFHAARIKSSHCIVTRYNKK